MLLGWFLFGLFGCYWFSCLLDHQLLFFALSENWLKSTQIQDGHQNGHWSINTLSITKLIFAYNFSKLHIFSGKIWVMGGQEYIGAYTNTTGLNTMAIIQDGCRNVRHSIDILSITKLIVVSNFAKNAHRDLISVTKPGFGGSMSTLEHRHRYLAK